MAANRKSTEYGWIGAFLRRYFDIPDTASELEEIRRTVSSIHDVTARIDERTERLEAAHNQMADAVTDIAGRM